jgi:hypothetical protein
VGAPSLVGLVERAKQVIEPAARRKGESLLQLISYQNLTTLLTGDFELTSNGL